QEGRKHVVRGVEEVEPVAEEPPGEPGHLRQRVAPRALLHGLELGGHRGKDLPVLSAQVDPKAESLGLGPRRHGLEEAPDVGADPAIADLARVDSDERRPAAGHAASSAASARAASVAAAAASHEKRAARTGPAARSRSRVGPSSSAVSMAAASAAGSAGAAVGTGSPPTSARASAVEATTGRPQASAWATGRPKPSASDG